MTSLVQLETFVDECTAVLEAKLEQFAASGTSIDVSHWMQCYAFDMIGRITTGERFGFLDSGEDIQGMMASPTEYLRYCARAGIFPEWHKILFRRNMRSKKLSGIAHVRDFATTQFEKKYAKFNLEDKKNADRGAPTDFITKLLRLQAQDANKIDKVEITSVCVMNVGAGSDTTSIAFASALFNLLKYPRCLHKLREEIGRLETQGLISDPVKFAEAQKMPYLSAVIKEALRIHPATGLPLGRVVPPTGATLAGQYFPPGSIVGINSWVAHANRDVFGLDAGQFRPERWLEDPEIVKKRESYFMTFGQGSRTCIGKNISLMELSKAIPQIVRHFDLEPNTGSGEPEWKTENGWFVKTSDFHFKVRKMVT